MLAAAAASACAFALYTRVEWRWFALGWIGLIPWLAALDRIRSFRGALAAGLAMSAAFTLAVFPWFVDAVRGYAGAPWIVALFVVLSLLPVLQPQFVAFAAARHTARRSGAGLVRTALTGAFAYVGAEWALPKLFADTIGYGFLASPSMRQAADLAGAAGLTFVLVLANECGLGVARALGRRAPAVERIRRATPPALCIAMLIAALLGYGAIRLRDVEGSERSAAPLTAGIVQADISNYADLAARLGTFEGVRLILDSHFELSRQALARAPLGLLVWPETVYPTTFGSPKSPAGADFDREIERFVETTQLPLVFGAYDAAGGEEYNAAMFLAPSEGGGTSRAAYRKSFLFPLTERTPAILDNALVRGWLPWLGTWKPGPGPRAVPLRLGDGRTLRIAPLICYDAVDPRIALAAVADGAELIVTLSNDSWFATGQGPHLHLVVSAFRSIETRRPQIRATNTGISAFVSATGEVRDFAGVHERAVLVASVAPDRSARTLMMAWGDWFGPSACAAAVALLGAAWSRRRGGVLS